MSNSEQTEGFPVAAVAAYLGRHLPEAGGAPLTVRQFGSGRSNPTYLLQAGDWTGVLRRPPGGPVAPGAHDVEREYRILSRLHPVYPRAPRPYLFCPDAELLGAPFYVMEFRPGVVVDDTWPAPWPPTAAVCRTIAGAMVGALADLHAVAYEPAGLAEFGRPEGFMARQVEGWSRRWQRAETQPAPEAALVARWLAGHLPPPQPPAVVHNDFKLNNLILAEGDPATVAGVLDWEMCTVGDPLADLGTLLAYWTDAAAEPVPGMGPVSVNTLPRFVSRTEVLERYARTSGRDVSAAPFYLAYGFFKTAVICQQLYQRWEAGLSLDARNQPLGQAALHLLRQAAQVTAGAPL